MSLDPVLLARSWPERRPVVRAAPLSAGGTRMRIRLPLAQEVAEREPVARTTV